jgi:hypothetical protein
MEAEASAQAEQGRGKPDKTRYEMVSGEEFLKFMGIENPETSTTFEA